MSSYTLNLYRRKPADPSSGVAGRLVWERPVAVEGAPPALQSLPTLERQWLDNQVSVSCIPSGKYKLAKQAWGKYYSAYKERWGHEFAVQVADVPGRSGILIHAGNLHTDSTGCVLVGQTLMAEPGKDKRLYNSREGYCVFYKAIAALFEAYDEVFIDIHRQSARRA